MNHTKTLIQEETHIVVTVEDNDHEPTELFRGTKRACQSYINKSNSITLEIKPIDED